jgi:PiT family inorganic phosphate transporter
MFAASAGTSGLGLAVLLIATIATLPISTATGIPTSITLALVGASAGAQIAQGGLGTDRVLRILVLAAAGPVVAYLLALAVTRLLTLSRGPQLERTVRWLQLTGFVATAIAYGANDRQKILAVFSVLFGVGVAGSAADPRVIALVIVCFAAGTTLGLRRSAHGLRQGVLHPKPYQVACTLWSSASAVLIGSVLAAPMSMTQSVTGALIGTAPPREWRRVRWEQSRRVVFAWLWTLPVAAVIGWALTLGITAFVK